MGRRSIRENKNVFQLLREAKGYSREKASELLGSIAYSRLVRIESGEVSPYPEEIIIWVSALISRLQEIVSCPENRTGIDVE